MAMKAQLKIPVEQVSPFPVSTAFFIDIFLSRKLAIISISLLYSLQQIVFLYEGYLNCARPENSPKIGFWL